MLHNTTTVAHSFVVVVAFVGGCQLHKQVPVL